MWSDTGQPVEHPRLVRHPITGNPVSSVTTSPDLTPPVSAGPAGPPRGLLGRSQRGSSEGSGWRWFDEQAGPGSLCASCWVHPSRGPPWAVMTAGWGSICCSHRVLMSAGLPARACSQVIQSPVRRDTTSAWVHQRGRHRKSLDEHRTMVGVRTPSSQSCTVEHGAAAASSADTPGAVIEGRHCRACHPRGRVVDVECTRCGTAPSSPEPSPRTALQGWWPIRRGCGSWPTGGPRPPPSRAPPTDHEPRFGIGDGVCDTRGG